MRKKSLRSVCDTEFGCAEHSRAMVVGLMKAPLVSVVMPVHNGARHLRDSMDSILAQTFADFEFILIDDASNDQTAQIIHSYADPRIRYIRNEKKSGIGPSLNKGLSAASGDFIARMDYDDISLPQRLERQLAYFEEYPDTGVLASFVTYTDEEGRDYPADFALYGERKSVTDKEVRRTLPYRNCIVHPSVMMRKAVCAKHRYDESVAIEDYEYWLRLAYDGVTIRKIPEALLKYRQHAASYSTLVHGTYGPMGPLIRTKCYFLCHTVRRPNLFAVRVFLYLLKDMFWRQA